MVTDRQVQANRSNAKLSTGPKSDEGKAIVAKNALKHGILSREVFIDEGLKKDFEEMKGNFYLQFEPQGQLELFLLERVITCAWRLSVLTRIEAQIYEKEDSNSWEKDPQIKRAFLSSYTRNALYTLNRYETSIERKFYQALSELKKEQSIRKFSQVTVPCEVIFKEGQEFGFVS